MLDIEQMHLAAPLIVRVGNRLPKALAFLNKSTSRCIYIRIQSLLVKF